MMRAIVASLKFISGGFIGLVLGTAAVVMEGVVIGDQGPPPVIDMAAAKPGAAGDGAVRVEKWSGLRILQRCRGACDELRP